MSQSGEEANELGAKLYISCKVGDFPNVMDLLDEIDELQDNERVCLPIETTRICFVSACVSERACIAYACRSPRLLRHHPKSTEKNNARLH